MQEDLASIFVSEPSGLSCATSSPQPIAATSNAYRKNAKFRKGLYARLKQDVVLVRADVTNLAGSFWRCASYDTPEIDRACGG